MTFMQTMLQANANYTAMLYCENEQKAAIQSSYNNAEVARQSAISDHLRRNKHGSPARSTAKTSQYNTRGYPIGGRASLRGVDVRGAMRKTRTRRVPVLPPPPQKQRSHTITVWDRWFLPRRANEQ